MYRLSGMLSTVVNLYLCNYIGSSYAILMVEVSLLEIFQYVDWLHLGNCHSVISTELPNSIN